MLHRIRNLENDDGSVKSEDKKKIEPTRIQTSSRSRQNGQGEQIFAEFKFFFEPDVNLIKTDQIEYEGIIYSILEFYPVRDTEGDVDHLEVWV